MRIEKGELGVRMRIEGVIKRWSENFCRIEAVLTSPCGKTLRLSVGTIAPDGRFQLTLPEFIPAYNFLLPPGEHCSGLNARPELLRIAVVELFTVSNDQNRSIGEMFQASARDIRTGGGPGEAMDWWYATVDGDVSGEQPCGSGEAKVRFDLRLRRGWNPVCRRIEPSGAERCRAESESERMEWFFSKYGRESG